jgi:ankyrin repeat protein
VPQLLHNNADTSLQNNRGTTALMYAGRYGKEECLQQLLHTNADTTLQNNYGRTVLMFAAREGHEELFHHNADASLTDKDGKTAI